MGVCVQTLRRREKSGQPVPDRKTGGGTRYYDRDRLIGLKKPDTALTVGYARVSCRDQKKDLETQKAMPESFCTANGWMYEIIDDPGSGMNYGKKGLKRLTRLVLTHFEEREKECFIHSLKEKGFRIPPFPSGKGQAST